MSLESTTNTASPVKYDARAPTRTSIGLTSVDTNKRGEIKITGTVAPNHTIQGGYLTDPRTRTNNSGLQTFIIDPHSEVDRSNPNWYYFTNYRGVFRNNLLVQERQRLPGSGQILRFPVLLIEFLQEAGHRRRFRPHHP